LSATPGDFSQSNGIAGSGVVTVGLWRPWRVFMRVETLWTIVMVASPTANIA
jgi:hypothetical protein